MNIDNTAYFLDENVEFQFKLADLEDKDLPSVYADDTPYITIRAEGRYIRLAMIFAGEEVKYIYLTANEAKGLRKVLKKMRKMLKNGG